MNIAIGDRLIYTTHEYNGPISASDRHIAIGGTYKVIGMDTWNLGRPRHDYKVLQFEGLDHWYDERAFVRAAPVQPFCVGSLR
jgi:hypothetical protein